MGGILRAAAWAATLVLCSCQGLALFKEPDIIDLGKNAKLYVPPQYVVQVGVDREAFLAPLVDGRDGSVPMDAKGPYPITWMPDSIWARPPILMLDGLCTEAVEQAGLFAATTRSTPVAAETLVFRPTLLRFLGGDEEQVAGRRSLARVAIRFEVLGPIGTDGERPVLFDETFEAETGTSVQLDPVHPPAVVGAAVSRVLHQALAAIDQSNVARSGLSR